MSDNNNKKKRKMGSSKSTSRSRTSRSTTPASNHEATAKEIKERNVIFQRTPFNPFNFESQWGKLSTLCDSKTPPNKAWKYFESATFVETYLKESGLEEGLFQALFDALGTDCCVMYELSKSQKVIKIKNRDWGFATQVVVTKEEDDDEDAMHSIQSSSVSPGRYDHACVLLEVVSGKKVGVKVKEVMAVVELKMSDSSCGPIQTEERQGKKMIADELDLIKEHGPVGQNIVYILDHVIRNHVKNNVQPTEIPIMILAGRRGKKEQNEQSNVQETAGKSEEKEVKKGINKQSNLDETKYNKLSYVRGNVHIPKAFGDAFKYSVSCFGDFDFEHYKEGIAAYINTLYCGAEAAKKACEYKEMKMIPSAITVPTAMLCSSEHKLHESAIPNCNLLASPIHEDSRFDPNALPKIHQGELFKAVLSREFFMNVEKEAIWFLNKLRSEETRASNMDEESKVLIKVSSRAVHRTLIDPSATARAFAFLYGMNCNALSEVLIGVWSPSHKGLVTIMKDLTEDYHRLEPCSMPNVSALWNSFAKLVRELLLPLARQDVVHCDIRAGWDHTANLLWKYSEDSKDRVGVLRVIELRVIDYESLCVITACNDVPEDPRCFHVQYSDHSADAFAFLWWQCLLVANAWLNQTFCNNLDARKFVLDCCDGKLSSYFKDFPDPADVKFLQEFGMGKKITETTVMESIEIFERRFTVLPGTTPP